MNQSSGVTTAPAAPAMRGARTRKGAQNIRTNNVVNGIDVANVQNVLYNFWKERVLLRSFQYYF